MNHRDDIYRAEMNPEMSVDALTKEAPILMVVTKGETVFALDY